MAVFSIHSVGAWNKSFVLALDDTPGQLIKGSQGILHGWAFINNTAAVAYIQVFDAAALADVSLGTTDPDFVIPLAASGISHVMGADINFVNGIVLFSTTTSDGSTAAATSGAVVWA